MTEQAPRLEVVPLEPGEDRLVQAYVQIGTPLDQLPYTDKFELLLDEAGLDHSPATRQQAWWTLCTLRKRGRLPRVVQNIVSTSGIPVGPPI